MKIAVVGAGAIGGYLGAKLALAGEEVTFIARNKNLAAIRAHGFRLILEDGSEQHAPGVRAVQHMAEASFRQAMLLSQGSLSIFWSNPLVGSIAGLALLLLLWPLVGNLKARLRAQERAAGG